MIPFSSRNDGKSILVRKVYIVSLFALEQMRTLFSRTEMLGLVIQALTAVDMRCPTHPARARTAQ